MGWRTLAAALDAGTASCAALNAAYFLQRSLSTADSAYARKVAAAILGLVSLATLVEALALLAVAAYAGEASFDAKPWAMVRLLMFTGTASISSLVVRQWLVR